jgi:hypothetical protein
MIAVNHARLHGSGRLRIQPELGVEPAAASFGDADVIRLLLAWGADPLARANDQATPSARCRRVSCLFRGKQAKAAIRRRAIPPPTVTRPTKEI